MSSSFVCRLLKSASIKNISCDLTHLKNISNRNRYVCRSLPISAVSAAGPSGAITERNIASKVFSCKRMMSSWRLRPYAITGTMALLPLNSLSAGFSKVGLSILVMPWKMWPAALVALPAIWGLPAAYKLLFHQAYRHTTASVYTVLLYMVMAFMPQPCFENLFSELTFYCLALMITYFVYTFFPEIWLHDFMFMHYLALYTLPMIPLAFSYFPMFAPRSFLFM